jgi:hypothetical protein
MRALFRIGVMLCASLPAAMVAGAQAPTTATLPPTRQVCDMSLRIVSMRLVDANGAPVSGATVAVRRVRTRIMIANAEAMGGQGDYKIAEDGSIPDLRKGGEPFDVTFTKDGRSRRVRVIIGTDASGCHVAMKSSQRPVTM